MISIPFIAFLLNYVMVKFEKFLFFIVLRRKFVKLKAQALLLVLVIILTSLYSALAHSYVYTYGYPARYSPPVTRYDRQAVLFIDKIANEPYLVISDRQFAEIGMAYFGLYTVKGIYAPYWDNYIRQLYGEVIKSPTSSTIKNAITKLTSSVHIRDVFIVINKVREPSFDEIISKLSSDPEIKKILLINDTVAIFRLDVD